MHWVHCLRDRMVIELRRGQECENQRCQNFSSRHVTLERDFILTWRDRLTHWDIKTCCILLWHPHPHYKLRSQNHGATSRRRRSSCIRRRCSSNKRVSSWLYWWLFAARACIVYVHYSRAIEWCQHHLIFFRRNYFDAQVLSICITFLLCSVSVLSCLGWIIGVRVRSIHPTTYKL